MNRMDLAAIGALTGRIIKEQPILADIMDRAKKGYITEQQAMEEMLSYLSERPEVNDHILRMADDATASVAGADEDSPADLFQSREDGMPALNPLLEAALAERAQFDGDIPELRTGQLPEGVRPSVPVDTSARNPVAVGRMLAHAADEMDQKVRKHEGKRSKLIEKVVEGDAKVLAVIEKHGELVLSADGEADAAAMIRGSAETDHPEYRRGALPAPQKVAEPTGAEMACMSPQELREAAWGFLSATQGRRSAVNTVRQLVAETLRRKGLDITERDYDSRIDIEGEPDAAHEWCVGLGGAGAMQPSFSVVDTAAGVLAAHLFKQVQASAEAHFILEVTTSDRFDDREVGWRGRLISGGTDVAITRSTAQKSDN